MDAGAVAAATGLDLEASALARQRAFSEPGLWRGGDDDRARFVSALAELGVAARAGGRFLTLSLGRTKADGMREVARRLKPDVTIALGDAPNDIEMLRQADYGVIVRNDHAPAIPPLAGEKSGRILRTRLAGPRGWNAAIARLLRELGIQ